MRLKDTGLTVADVKAMAQKYQIETYERMDFLADWAEGVYMYDENDQPTWTSMLVSPLTPWATATPRLSLPFRSSALPDADLQLSLHRSSGPPVQGDLRGHRYG